MTARPARLLATLTVLSSLSCSRPQGHENPDGSLTGGETSTSAFALTPKPLSRIASLTERCPKGCGALQKFENTRVGTISIYRVSTPPSEWEDHGRPGTEWFGVVENGALWLVPLGIGPEVSTLLVSAHENGDDEVLELEQKDGTGHSMTASAALLLLHGGPQAMSAVDFYLGGVRTDDLGKKTGQLGLVSAADGALKVTPPVSSAGRSLAGGWFQVRW